MRNIQMLAILIVSAFAASALPAGAQTEPRRVEIGGGLDSIFVVPIFDGGADVVPSANIRVTAPLSRRFALEGFLEAGRMYESTGGLYGIQVKQRLLRASTPTREVFLTYGIAGGYSHYAAEEYRYTGPNGPEVYRTAAHTNVVAPIFPLVGGGIQQRVATRLAVRVEGQLVTWLYVPVAVRALAGVSIPIGRSSGY